jgi:hypothetical protein
MKVVLTVARAELRLQLLVASKLVQSDTVRIYEALARKESSRKVQVQMGKDETKRHLCRDLA